MAFPQIEHCLLCDAVRVEQDNKLTLLGFLGITPSAGAGIKDFTQPVALTFVLVGGPGDGTTYRLASEVVTQQGTVVAPKPTPQPAIALAPARVTLLATLTAVYPGQGRYTFRFYADEVLVYETTFLLTQPA